LCTSYPIKNLRGIKENPSLRQKNILKNQKKSLLIGVEDRVVNACAWVSPLKLISIAVPLHHHQYLDHICKDYTFIAFLK
jgi:hypothetical protein